MCYEKDKDDNATGAVIITAKTETECNNVASYTPTDGTVQTTGVWVTSCMDTCNICHHNVGSEGLCVGWAYYDCDDKDECAGNTQGSG